MSGHVIPFPRSTRKVLPALRRASSDFDLLTALVIRDRRRRGEIDPDTAASYLAALRMQP